MPSAALPTSYCLFSVDLIVHAHGFLFLLEIHTDPRIETLSAIQLLFSLGVEKPQLLYSVVSGHPSTFLLLWEIGIFGQDHKV